MLSVISDKPIPHYNFLLFTPTVDYFLADIRQASDYSPFGVQLSGRTLTASSVTKKYRMGYQGSEMDNEVKGDGNSYTTEYRFLDPRLGRWLSLDPKSSNHPEKTPYHAMSNSPIARLDPNGDDDIFDVFGNYLGSTKEGSAIRVATWDYTFEQVSTNFLEKTKLLTDFSYTEDDWFNRQVLSNIATYYACFAGIDEKVRVEETPGNKDATAYYSACRPLGESFPPCDDDFFAVNVTPDGKIKESLNDANNFVVIFRHEKVHQDDYRTHQPFYHIDAILTACKDPLYPSTTEQYKQSQLKYAGDLLNQSLNNPEVTMEMIQERITQIQEVFKDQGEIYYDEEEQQVMYSINLEAIEINGEH